MATQATPSTPFTRDAGSAPPLPGGLPNAWGQFLLLAAVYVLINFILTRHSLSPVHQDDYLALGYGYEDMRWLMSRPVSTNFIYLMGALGPAVAYPMLALMTLAVPFLVLRFLQKFFDVRFGWAAVLLFGAVAFSHMSALEHTKFLGLFTNLTSHLFGLFALLLILDAWRGRDLAKAALAVASYATSAFAKEDFLLPPLILLALLAFEEMRATRATRAGFPLSRWSLAFGIAVGLAAFSAVAFNFFLSNNPFVSGVAAAAPATDPYAVQMGPAALAKSFYKLTFGFVPVPSVLVLAGLAAAWRARPAARLRLLALAAILVALILPYALIPNNMPDYRAFSWLSWFGGTAALAILWVSERTLGARAGLLKAATIVIPVVLAVGVFQQAYPQRSAVAGWYRAQQGANETMLASLRAHRSLIAREEVVGIVGVDVSSPWANTDAQFLHRKLYFDNKWIVFVDKDSIFFQIDPIVDGQVTSAHHKKFITVQQTERLCTMPELLVLVFDAAGNGTPMRAAEWCAKRQPVAPVPSAGG
jgi:hypothetical protein